MTFDPERVREAWREYRRSKGDVDRPAEGRPAKRLQINHRLSDTGEVHPSPRLFPARAPVESVSSRASLDFSPQSTRAAALEELARTREVADGASREGEHSWAGQDDAPGPSWEADSFPRAAADLPPRAEGAPRPLADPPSALEEVPRTLGELAGDEAGTTPLRDGAEPASSTSGWSIDSASLQVTGWKAGGPAADTTGPSRPRSSAGRQPAVPQPRLPAPAKAQGSQKMRRSLYN